MGSNVSKSAGKVLVVYYSLSGNTARVARDIAKLMGADVEGIRSREYGGGLVGYLKAVADAVRGMLGEIGSPVRDPHDYELTIIGTPVWAWNMTPAVRAYLQKCQGQFNDVAFFVTSGDTDAAKIVPAMEALARRKPLAFTGFNARELGNPATYEAKVANFVSALRGAHRQGDVEIGAPAPATHT